jgi:hypothetical protein
MTTLRRPRLLHPDLVRPPLRIRAIGLLAAAAVVVGATYAASWLSPRAVPVPLHADSAAIAPHLVDQGAIPAELADIDASIAIWAPKAAADARDDISASNLAILYLGRGRITGDANDYARALAAADRAVAAWPTSSGTQTLKATVLQATHDFHGALDLASSVLGREPTNVDALAVVGDAQLELGRLPQARQTYNQLESLLPGPALDARIARLDWLSGDATAAIRLATQANQEAADSDASDPSFYPAQLGEMARLTGDATTARTAYAAALALRPTNQLALLGRARLEAFDGNDAEAIADLRTAAAIAPRPETLAFLADLLERGGDSAGADRQAKTIGVIDQLGGTSAQLFDRQILGFDLDHGLATQAVLDRATAAAVVRPDAAGLDTVAWAAYRLGDLSTARAQSDAALALGSIDARILYHAGAIRIAAGDLASGQPLVGRALALGPALDPLDRAAAEALIGG